MGQTNGSNVLTDPDALQYYLAAPFYVNSSPDGVDSYRINSLGQPPVLASVAYNTLSITGNSTGHLGLKNATLYSEYTCQIPQIKGAGYPIVTILVNDLVFLQTLWMIYCWLWDGGWRRRIRMQWCVRAVFGRWKLVHMNLCERLGYCRIAIRRGSWRSMLRLCGRGVPWLIDLWRRHVGERAKTGVYWTWGVWRGERWDDTVLTMVMQYHYQGKNAVKQ